MSDNIPVKESTSLTMELKELAIKCPICLKNCTPPVYVCRRGHQICGSCKEKICHCPTCLNESQDVRGAHRILFVYDITESITLSDIDGWMGFANKYCPEECVKMIVGNKMDLTEERKISTFVGEAVAEKLGLPFCETSAKDGSNVEAVFRTLVARILEAPYLSKTSTNIVELEVGSAPEEKRCLC